MTTAATKPWAGSNQLKARGIVTLDEPMPSWCNDGGNFTRNSHTTTKQTDPGHEMRGNGIERDKNQSDSRSEEKALSFSFFSLFLALGPDGLTALRLRVHERSREADQCESMQPLGRQWHLIGHSRQTWDTPPPKQAAAADPKGLEGLEKTAGVHQDEKRQGSLGIYLRTRERIENWRAGDHSCLVTGNAVIMNT